MKGWIVLMILAFCSMGLSKPLTYYDSGLWISDPKVSAKGHSLKQNVESLLMNSRFQTAPLLPAGSELISVQSLKKSLIIELHLPESFLQDQISEDWLETMSRLLDFNLQALSPESGNIYFTTVYKGQSYNLSHFLNIVPVPDKEPEHEASLQTSKALKTTVSGPLSDKLLFISQAHGWIDYDSPIAWETQRGITHDIVEDFVNSEAINQYLLEYLSNAGAKIFTLRERSMNTNMVIVDNEDLNDHPDNGSYEEIGDPGLFSNSGANGFKNFQAPYSSTNDPFRHNGGSDRLIATDTVETARAVWKPVIVEDGYYDVYVSFSGVGDRPADAKYIISHGGIETEVTVNQTRHRYVWNHIGKYYFKVGDDDFVALSNQSSEPGTSVSADAVRFGGGMGDVEGTYHATTSTHPRWEEGARTWVQYQGATSSVYSGGDVSSRSRFADWEHYSVEDSVYVSWHSNAFNGSAKGTSSYIYSSNPPDGSYDDSQAIAGSAELQSSIHSEIINDIRAGWDPGWTDRGLRSAYFGEVNPSHNDEMPAVLIEMAFHDNAEDADALRHPQFRKLAARAVYQGIVKYFAQRDTLPVNLLPEPPTHLQVSSPQSGSLLASWQAPALDSDGLVGDAASSYLVYLSTDGKNFDNGVETSDLFYQWQGLNPGDLYYIKVRAKNAGGLSLATETLSSRIANDHNNFILVVNGFDRLNSGQLIYQNMPDVGGFVDRMYLDQMNSYDYVIPHAKTITAANRGFDSVANEVVEEGLLTLDPNVYPLVIWILGEESSLGSTLTAAEQSQLSGYLSSGGKLFISGAEIGWDLDHLGSASDQSFYNDVLMTEYLSDDANSFEVSSYPFGPFADIDNFFFDDGTHGSYRVEYPDEIDALNAAASCLTYVGAQSACTYVDSGIYQVIHLGFPFETIYPEVSQQVVMDRALEFFGVLESDDLIYKNGFN